MTERDDDLIKKRAYALWESEGRPEGRHDEHWDQAFKELSDSDDTAVLGEPESDAVSTDEAPPAKAVPPLSVVEGGVSGSPGAKRKRKTI